MFTTRVPSAFEPYNKHLTKYEYISQLKVYMRYCGLTYILESQISSG